MEELKDMKMNEKIKKPSGERRDSLKVKCPSCDHVNTLEGLSAWSYIILREVRCTKCSTKIKAPF